MPTTTISPATHRSADELLPDATGMGAVTLAVEDLDKMVAYYRDGLGLQLLAEHKGTATLGRQGKSLMVLDQDGDLSYASPRAAGLYHTAFLFDQADQLASTVASVARKYGDRYQGASDHLVSEAFYFADAEGNGVELYIDRPRDAWDVSATGEVKMATLALDPNRFLNEHLTEAGSESVADTPAVVGHVHLKVGNIAAAREFYVETLGFEPTFEYGSQALFVSAGGYHHHLGMNTWESKGAGDREPALGLGEVTIALPGSADGGPNPTDALTALNERLSARGIAREFDGHELTVYDPWRNRVRITTDQAA